MRSTYAAWCAAVVLAALAPVGLRALSWRAPTPQDVDPTMAKAGKLLYRRPLTEAELNLRVHAASDAANRTALKDHSAELDLRGVPRSVPSEDGFFAVIKSPRWKIKNVV